MQKILVCAFCRGAACGEWKIENGKWKVKSFQVCHSEERSDVGISGRQLRFRRWLSHDPAGYCEIATSAYGLLAMTSRGASSVLTAAGTDRGGPSRDCHVGLWPPRNDKFESIVRSTMPTYHLPACMAVTDRRYRCNRFLRFYRQPVQVGSTAQGAARRSPTAHVCLLFSQNYSLFIFQYL